MSEESVESGNYKRYRSGNVVAPCDCDGPGVMGGVNVKENGEAFCTSCGKKLEVMHYILFGCEDCVKSRIRELDKVEKNFYLRELPKMFPKDEPK